MDLDAPVAPVGSGHEAETEQSFQRLVPSFCRELETELRPIPGLQRLGVCGDKGE